MEISDSDSVYYEHERLPDNLPTINTRKLPYGLSAKFGVGIGVAMCGVAV